MRCLGIDYGTKRVGLAHGDEIGVATPLPALTDADEAARWAKLGAVTDEELWALRRTLRAKLVHVVRDEDYFTGLRIQQAVQTGAKSEFVFGRNEGPCQRFHTWVESLVQADTPADTSALFRAAEEFHHP